MVVNELLSPDDTVVTLYFGSVQGADTQTCTLHRWSLGDPDAPEQEWWLFPRRAPAIPTSELKLWLAHYLSDVDVEVFMSAASRRLPHPILDE
jgi:hypothetical protein